MKYYSFALLLATAAVVRAHEHASNDLGGGEEGSSSSAASTSSSVSPPSIALAPAPALPPSVLPLPSIAYSPPFNPSNSISSNALLTTKGGLIFADLGCFVDSPERALPELQIEVRSADPVSECLTACADKGYSFAGLEFHSQCFCANFINPQMTPATSGCDTRCTGNSLQTCGGVWRLSLYQLISDIPIPEDPVINWSEVGCFASSPDSPAVVAELAVDLSWGTLISSCQDICLSNGFPFAAIERDNMCLCGSNLNPNLIIEDTKFEKCNMKCGGEDKKCGGIDYARVWQTEITYSIDHPYYLASPPSPPHNGDHGGHHDHDHHKRRGHGRSMIILKGVFVGIIISAIAQRLYRRRIEQQQQVPTQQLENPHANLPPYNAVSGDEKV